MEIRRLWLTAALALGMAHSTAGAEKIVISNWDGYMPADLLEKFTQETGIEAELAVHGTNEEIMGKVVAGKGRGYDVLFVSSPFAEVLNNLDLAAPIDHSLVPNMKNLYPEATRLEHDPGNKFSVPYAWGTTGLCYRADLVSGTPDSWSDLLEPADALKGKITMLSTGRWLIAAGLLAQGSSINSINPDEIDSAKKALQAAKRNLLAYDDTTFYSKLVSGEAVLTHAWDGWCNYGIAENADIKYIVPKEGTDLFIDTMVVTEASENKEAAHRFINYVLEAENGAWVPSNILYKVPNKAAMDALDPALIEQFPNLGMTVAGMLKQEQFRDLGENTRLVQDASTEILASQ